MLAEALIELSDIATCIAGDFHTMHLNVVGAEFDIFHKEVLKEYYEQAADDYDTIAEMARRKPWRTDVPSQNEAAIRIDWRSFSGACTRASTIQEIDARLEQYLKSMNDVFRSFNDKTDCPQSQGIASWLQDRLNYWGAEWGFFNSSREEAQNDKHSEDSD